MSKRGACVGRLGIASSPDIGDACGRPLLAVSIAVSLAGGSPLATAETEHSAVTHFTAENQSLDPELVLLCPPGREPQFQNERTGKVSSISDARLRAIAKKACSPNALEAAENVNVSVTNSQKFPIYVAFTNYSTGTPGQITWDPSCTVSNDAVTIGANETCQASVPSTAGISPILCLHKAGAGRNRAKLQQCASQ